MHLFTRYCTNLLPAHSVVLWSDWEVEWCRKQEKYCKTQRLRDCYHLSRKLGSIDPQVTLNLNYPLRRLSTAIFKPSYFLFGFQHTLGLPSPLVCAWGIQTNFNTSLPNLIEKEYLLLKILMYDMWYVLDYLFFRIKCMWWICVL